MVPHFLPAPPLLGSRPPPRTPRLPASVDLNTPAPFYPTHSCSCRRAPGSATNKAPRLPAQPELWDWYLGFFYLLCASITVPLVSLSQETVIPRTEAVMESPGSPVLHSSCNSRTCSLAVLSISEGSPAKLGEVQTQNKFLSLMSPRSHQNGQYFATEVHFSISMATLHHQPSAPAPALPCPASHLDDALSV